MPWTVKYLDAEKIVEVTYTGQIPPQELMESVQETLRTAKQHGTSRYLADCQEMEAGPSVLEVYELPKFYDEIFVDRRSREAMILPRSKEAAADIRFYETACRNRGFNVRTFPGREEALSWLME